MHDLRWRCLLTVGCVLLLATPDIASAAVHGAAIAADDSFTDRLWHVVRHKPHAVVILFAFLLSLIAGDDQAWGWLLVVFLLVLLGTIVAFEHNPGLLHNVQPSPFSAAITTGVLAVVGMLLFALHLKRPGFFATTEIAFALAGIYFSIRGIGSTPSAWVGLGVSMYGLVEGFDRLAKAIDQAIGPDESDDDRADPSASLPKAQPPGSERRAD